MGPAPKRQPGTGTPSARNELGQPVGLPVPPECTSAAPEREQLTGTWCTLTPLSAEIHAAELFRAFSEDADCRDWTYLPYGPFAGEADFSAWLRSVDGSDDPLFFTIIDKRTARAAGVLSLMRISPQTHCIEVGHVHYAPALQRTPAATEAFFLLARYAFEQLRYRRLEWKCDALNQRSCRAARRLGFQFEGVFRKHLTYKGRNRDTAWFSMLDDEWPERARELRTWLAPENFDVSGQQRRSLREVRDTQ